MKRISSLIILAYLLTGCSLFERKPEDPNEPPFEPNESADTFSGLEAPAENAATPATNAKAVAHATPAATPGNENYMENEIARLNSKVEALETKLASLSENVQSQKDHNAQPRLRAEPIGDEEAPPTASISQDVDPDAEPVNAKLANRATPIRNSREIATEETPLAAGESVEKSFQQAMQYLNSKKYKEAANQFVAIAKANRSHALASHALYWAGEAGARAQNWKMAIHHWTNLENNYPRSIYLSETLAGLANAYAASDNDEKAKRYRDTLVKAFPDSPASGHVTANLSDVEQGE